MKFNKQTICSIALTVVGVLFFCFKAAATPEAAAVNQYASSVKQIEEGMTLWQMLAAGGSIMLLLGVLSLLALAIIVYNFMTLQIEKLAPKKFFEEVLYKLERKDTKALRTLCESQFNNNVMAKIIVSGLDNVGRGAVSVREAVESKARQEIGTLWQNINYLADIGAVAPLVGLLGSVIGMIQAFNVFVYHSVALKPIMLVGGVSKAMVTTAGGLFIAIPALIVYAYFKGRLLNISNVIETSSIEVIKIMEENETN